jgi:AcrR family transcriptional regulator
MEPTTGRRELNKQRTLRAIRASAMGLFATYGFDHVTTAQVAEQAGVSPATVFNYFATKEDLFFGEVEDLERKLSDLIAAVPSGASIWTALQGHVLWELTAGRAYTDPHAVTSFHAILAASPSLRAREAEIYERRVVVLTKALGDAGHEPLTASVAARQFIAVEQLAAAELRRRLTTRSAPRRILRELDELVGEIFDIMRAGVGDLIAHAPTDRLREPARPRRGGQRNRV